MSPYETELAYTEDMPCSRLKDIVEALDRLHSAISKLDNYNYERFWSRSLEHRMSRFSVVEGLRDVVPEDRRMV